MIRVAQIDIITLSSVPSHICPNLGGFIYVALDLITILTVSINELEMHMVPNPLETILDPYISCARVRYNRIRRRR